MLFHKIMTLNVGVNLSSFLWRFPLVKYKLLGQPWKLFMSVSCVLRGKALRILGFHCDTCHQGVELRTLIHCATSQGTVNTFLFYYHQVFVGAQCLYYELSTVRQPFFSFFIMSLNETERNGKGRGDREGERYSTASPPPQPCRWGVGD